MPTINQLSAVQSVNAGDLLPVYQPAAGDARKLNIASLIDYLNANFAPVQRGHQQEAILATGFSVGVDAEFQSYQQLWLQLLPVAAFASGTIVLPPQSTAIDNQELIVTCSKQVTALSFNLNGASAFNGAPTAINADGFFRCRYDAATTSWYRVG